MKKIIIFLFIVCILSIPANTFAIEVRWNDFRKPFAWDTRVCHNDPVKISVNLPADFLSKDDITLSITVTSNTVTASYAVGTMGFEAMTPAIGVNGSFLRTYFVPVKDTPRTQSYDIKIKRKHLKIGANVLKVSYNWKEQNAYCKSSCCSFELNQLSFRNAPTADYIAPIKKDGREIILHPDGIWKYKSETNDKPEGATVQYKSKKGFVSIWINPQVWAESHFPFGLGSEFSFIRKDGDAYAMVIVERMAFPPSDFKDLMIKFFRMRMPDVAITREEIKVVNGTEILSLDMEATVFEIPSKYRGYFWTGKTGTVQVITYTSQNLFDEFEKQMTDLLNGLIILKKQ